MTHSFANLNLFFSKDKLHSIDIEHLLIDAKILKGQNLGVSRLVTEDAKINAEEFSRVENLLEIMDRNEDAGLGTYTELELKEQFVDLYKLCEDPFGERIKGIRFENDSSNVETVPNIEYY